MISNVSLSLSHSPIATLDFLRVSIKRGDVSIKTAGLTWQNHRQPGVDHQTNLAELHENRTMYTVYVQLSIYLSIYLSISIYLSMYICISVNKLMGPKIQAGRRYNGTLLFEEQSPVKFLGFM